MGTDSLILQRQIYDFSVRQIHTYCRGIKLRLTWHTWVQRQKELTKTRNGEDPELLNPVPELDKTGTEGQKAKGGTAAINTKSKGIHWKSIIFNDSDAVRRKSQQPKKPSKQE
jgi:hypothetical protein